MEPENNRNISNKGSGGFFNSVGKSFNAGVEKISKQLKGQKPEKAPEGLDEQHEIHPITAEQSIIIEGRKEHLNQLEMHELKDFVDHTFEKIRFREDYKVPIGLHDSPIDKALKTLAKFFRLLPQLANIQKNCLSEIHNGIFERLSNKIRVIFWKILQS